MSKVSTTKIKGDISIVLCGQAGQGIQTVEFLLTRILKLAGFNVFATKEYMSRIRGGMNSTEIRASTYRVSAMVRRVDVLIALDRGAIEHIEERLSPDTLILGEKKIITGEDDRNRYQLIDVPFTKIASEIGNVIYSNVVAVGTLSGLLGLRLQQVIGYIKDYFSAKSAEIIKNNVKAAEAGYKVGTDLAQSGKITVNVATDAQVKDELLLSGAEAVGLGAIAGGCNFVSSYPMSPSTGVLVFLAKHGKDFGIIAEQAEDEIAAMNMAIGAWYAGARGMVTTSGGGFALMTEGLSLSAMLETPVVIHLAQRPGPATGLPTRTEQADLELALYAGHGEFPRIILTPGTLQEAFHLTQKAFSLADKFQVPVFVLTDQYLIDSYYNITGLKLEDIKVEKHFIKTTQDYRRYEINADGVSPRGIAGYGKGLVCVDSDEHDIEGHITENLNLRTKMVDKRLKKLESIREEIVPPELIGPEKYRNLIICWGSTYHIVREAIEVLSRDDTAMLHFKQVYPLHPGTVDYLKSAERAVIIEGNATGQLGKQIKLSFGIDVDRKVLKYNGLSFAVEEVVDKLQTLLS
jgi:2-oxoglutarate ferredoxin oxidoreductase subunit alpha